jgi:hypothetical protein
LKKFVHASPHSRDEIASARLTLEFYFTPHSGFIQIKRLFTEACHSVARQVEEIRISVVGGIGKATSVMLPECFPQLRGAFRTVVITIVIGREIVINNYEAGAVY